MSSYFDLNATPTTELYTLSLHDALPISPDRPILYFKEFSSYARRAVQALESQLADRLLRPLPVERVDYNRKIASTRSEEHTSELQSQSNLVCRLLLEKKKNNRTRTASPE